MRTVATPLIRALSSIESQALLDRSHVGRVAFSWRDHVDIEPINFVSDRAWIFGRTSQGTKLTTLLHHPWCAFEVDEVNGPFDWSSVVVKGKFNILDPEVGSPDLYDRALTLVREMSPGMFEESDLAPSRSILFGISIDRISGKTARL
jgi:uncharacterized protein